MYQETGAVSLPLLLGMSSADRSGALIGIFLTGSVAAAASIVRLNALYIYTVSKDIPYDAIFVSRATPLADDEFAENSGRFFCGRRWSATLQ